ncbi:hypothetical protein [Scytonema sp. PRP1]|uniref:hypothetical protein n=1 Tax=Scytonema sp. PRP1 TaxID=3120513 RepID=UPI002FD6F757
MNNISGTLQQTLCAAVTNALLHPTVVKNVKKIYKCAIAFKGSALLAIPLWSIANAGVCVRLNPVICTIACTLSLTYSIPL